MSIAQNLQEVKTACQPLTLVAVSKFHPAALVQEAYDAGQRIFGESRVQELLEKQQCLPQDIAWHFIGHLQPNKVKYIAPFISLIHAIDTPKLLAEVNKQGAKCGRVIPVLMQLHIATEETKFGFSPDELDAYLASLQWREYTNVQISGIMCMASNVEDEAQIAAEFDKAHQYFLHAKALYFKDSPDFATCSWGMSGDFPIAMQHGSTMVRVGTRIFGAR